MAAEIETKPVTGGHLVPPPIRPDPWALTPPQWGMISFLVSEVAFFSTLIVAFVIFLGQDLSGPTAKVLWPPGLVIVTTIVLLSSSGTIHVAESALKAGRRGGFLLWWGATILLGAGFLLGTAYEWNELITREHLTISRNLFGTTYYTLVGFHAFHVTVGVLVMAVVFGLALRGQIQGGHNAGVELTAWYWHFVDVVWVVVFTVVYLVGPNY